MRVYFEVAGDGLCVKEIRFVRNPGLTSGFSILKSAFSTIMLCRLLPIIHSGTMCCPVNLTRGLTGGILVRRCSSLKTRGVDGHRNETSAVHNTSGHPIAQKA
jgi:hypothetical protein